MKKWMARAVGALVVLGVLALMLYGYLPKPQPVDVVLVRRGPIQVTVDEEAKTRVRDRYMVAAPTVGIASRIELEPGDVVKPGMVLATIRPLRSALLDPRARAAAEASLAAALDAERQSEAAVARAEAVAEGARRGHARTERLAKEGSATPQELDASSAELRAREGELASARFAAKVAAHQVQSARAVLGLLQGQGARRTESLPVTSPIAGQVLRLLQESEGPVAVGTPLIEIGDVAALEVVADLLTRDAVLVRPGMRVILDRWGGERPLEGRVRRVEPSAFTFTSALGVQEQRVNVLVDLAGAPAEREPIGDGYALETRFVLFEAPNVLLVPRSAVFRQGDGWAVFSIRAGHARLATVRLGHSSSAEAEVLEGLTPGSPVIVHPGDSVADGVAVKPRR
jgi:HlyD family secretion protein